MRLKRGVTKYKVSKNIESIRQAYIIIGKDWHHIYLSEAAVVKSYAHQRRNGDGVPSGLWFNQYNHTINLDIAPKKAWKLKLICNTLIEV